MIKGTRRGERRKVNGKKGRDEGEGEQRDSRIDRHEESAAVSYSRSSHPNSKREGWERRPSAPIEEKEGKGEIYERWVWTIFLLLEMDYRNQLPSSTRYKSKGAHGTMSEKS